MCGALKALEARLRRAAAWQGLTVTKSRRRGVDGGYRIIDPQTKAVVHDGAAGDYSLTLEQAEAWIGNPQKSISSANLTLANDT